jgi:ABC-type transport system involved in multi-copper enzyme maturation permease subunit
MLTTIIKKEILENILSFRFPLFTLICIILVPLGIYVNSLDYAKRVRDFNEQVRLSNEAIATSQMGDVISGTLVMKGFRHPSLLSVFAQGFESTLPRFYEFKQDGYKQGETSSGDESILSVQGKLDFLFIIQMVVSLIVLLFASDMIAGEKESGTLRGILSNCIPRDALLFGKITGGYIALWFPFIIAFLIGILVLIVSSFPFFTEDMPTKVLVIFLSASFFLLTYFTIGILVSTNSDKARTSLVIILVVWAFFQLIVPKLSDMIATVVYPVRTETEVSLEKSLITKTINDETAYELGRQYEAIFGKDHRFAGPPEQTPEQQKWETVKKDIEEKAKDQKARQLNDIEEAYRREKRVQQTIATNLSLISPSAAFARLTTDICGTGEMEKTKYAEAVRAYQQSLDAELFGRAKRTMMRFPDGRVAVSFSAEPVDMKSLPSFSVTHASLTETFKENWRSLLSLVFWLIAPFAVAYVRFLKYDVR